MDIYMAHWPYIEPDFWSSVMDLNYKGVKTWFEWKGVLLYIMYSAINSWSYFLLFVLFFIFIFTCSNNFRAIKHDGKEKRGEAVFGNWFSFLKDKNYEGITGKPEWSSCHILGIIAIFHITCTAHAMMPTSGSSLHFFGKQPVHSTKELEKDYIYTCVCLCARPRVFGFSYNEISFCWSRTLSLEMKLNP